MPTHKDFHKQYLKYYNELANLDPKFYFAEIVIVFIDGRVHHRDFYTFFIDEERIIEDAKILSSNEIDHITYQIEKRAIAIDEEDIE